MKLFEPAKKFKMLFLLLALLVLMELGYRLSQLLQSTLASWGWVSSANIIIGGFVVIICSILPISLLEYFSQANMQKKFRLNAVIIWFLVAVMSYPVALLAGWLIATFQIKSVFSNIHKQWGVPSAILLLAYMIVFDFFYYLFHRAQHTFGVLWRVHSVHHSIRDMSAMNSYHHLLEDLLRVPLVILPLTFLIGLDAEVVIFVSAFTAAWGYFLHMNANVHLGALGCLLGDARYHRVHHSLDPLHWNKNYAAFFPPWDRLFGTQVMPPDNAILLPVGLQDIDHPSDVFSYVKAPFKR